MIPYRKVYYGLSSTNLFTPIPKLSIFLYVYITETEGDIMNSNKVNYKNICYQAMILVQKLAYLVISGTSFKNSILMEVF